MADPKPTPTPVFEGWSRVPPGLHTVSQLSDLDMPRVPVGAPIARVSASPAYSNKRTEFDLYRLSDSVPSPATGPRLLSYPTWKDDRTAETSHTCADCDARTERPCPVRDDHGRRLCQACAQIADILAAQALTQSSRLQSAAWAAGLVAGDPVRYVHVRTIAGTAKKPTAVAQQFTVADHDGTPLRDVTVHCGKPRARGVPPGALAPEAAVLRLAAVLEGQRVAVWEHGHGLALAGILGLIPKVRARVVADRIRAHATAWRGELDPRTRELRTATDPGRADRVWLLVARMAATPVPDTDPEPVLARLRSDPNAAHLYLSTHHPETVARIEGVFRMLGMAAGPTVITRGAHSRRLPGAYEMQIPIRPDGLPVQG
ncbi:hypothetical protein OG216_25875 [Streptomycetaceae bacterium NBC_01309]